MRTTERFTTAKEKITTRTAKTLGAVGIATGAFLSTACGGSEGAPVSNENVLAAGPEAQAVSAASTAVYGEACKSRSDVYMVGIAAKSGIGGFDSKEDFARAVRLYDGPKGSSTSVKISIEDEPEHLNNLWEGYQADRAENPDVDGTVEVVLYGSDVQEDTEGYDGKINKGLASCAFLKYAHGTLR